MSCDQQPVAPTAEPVAEAAAFDFMNGPEHAGMVYRWTDHWIYFNVFEETPGDPWMVIFGLSDADVLLDCGGDGSSELRHIKEVWFDETWRSILLTTRKDADVRAVNLAEFQDTWDADGFCAAFALAPVATGVARYQYQDTDSWWQLPRSVWQEKANGYVDYMGERYRLHFSAHWKWNESLPEPYSERIVAWIK